MKKVIYALCVLSFLFARPIHGPAQTPPTKKDTVNAIRGASHLSSGNSKDVLVSFFQLALKDISKKKEFNFNSNLFALKLKTNPALSIDTNFIRQTFARNSNIQFSLKLDSNYNFNGAKAGYKYAIVNNRDYAASKLFNSMVLAQANGHLTAFQQIAKEISAKFQNDPGTLTTLVLEMNKFFNDTTFKFKSLSPQGQQLVRNFFQSDKFKFEDSWNPRVDFNQITRRVINEFQKKLLWTIAANFATNSNARFTDINVVSEATAGVLQVNPKNFIEFAIKADFLFTDDSLGGGNDLKRQVLTSEFGFNWVAKGANHKPFLEFKAAGGFDYIPSVVYANEKRTTFILTSTFRIRITDEIWIPVDIKYDPEAGNVFGFLNITSNFDLLNKLFGKL